MIENNQAKRRAPAARLKLLTAIAVTLLVGSAGIALTTPTFTAHAATSDTEGLFPDNQTPPGAVLDPDRSSVEIGMRFSPKTSGSATGVQAYKISGSRSATPTSGTLWNSSGRRLAQVTFQQTSRTGWLAASFGSPVDLTAGQTYTVSAFMPRGTYAVTENYFSTNRSNSVLNVPTSNNGVYRYAGTSSFPASTFRASNYWVDIAFTPATTTPSSSPTPTPSASSNPTPTPSASSSPTQPPTTTPTPSPTPTAAGCVGAANTPGGADPWGGCWPGPHNTGYPQGLPGDTRTPVALTTYTGPTTIRSCGVVIESKIINSTILIEAGNGTKSKETPCVVIRNSLVKGVIFAEKSSYGPVLIEDTEVAPPDLPWWENIGRSNFFAYRVNSHRGQAVIKCDTNCEAKDNWVHGMELGGSYHYNAFGGNGTNNFRIEHNYGTCGDWSKVSSSRTGDAGCSAVIGFYGDFAPIQNITIHRNFLASTFDISSSGVHAQAGYCLNPGYYPGKPYPDTRNLTVTDNVFARGGSGKCGVFGPSNSLNGHGAPNGNIWQMNRFDDGTTIARPEE